MPPLSKLIQRPANVSNETMPLPQATILPGHNLPVNPAELQYDGFHGVYRCEMPSLSGVGPSYRAQKRFWESNLAPKFPLAMPPNK